MEEYRRKRILLNAKKDTERKKKKERERKKERKKEVTYKCVGTLLSYARIILLLLHFLLEHSCRKWKGIKSGKELNPAVDYVQNTI
jgi:hypothetical protein